MFRQAPLPSPGHERIFALLSQAKVEIVTATAGTGAAGKTLAELSLCARTGASVIAVLRGGEGYPNPAPSFALEQGDWVVLIGTAREVERAEALLTASGPEESIAPALSAEAREVKAKAS